MRSTTLWMWSRHFSESELSTRLRNHCQLPFSERSQPVHDRSHDNLVVLVKYRGARTDDAVLRSGGRTANVQNFRFSADLVIWANGVGPANLFDASADHPAG